MADQRCRDVQALIPELALGLASGDERARTLAHVDRCADCRAVLGRTADTVDELLLLAPEHEPPAGFDGRVLAAMRPGTARRRVTWLAAAAAVVLVALGAATVTRWVDSDERQLAAQYRETLEVADGSYLRASALANETGDEAGHVFAYEGRPSWVFMTVDGAPSGDYDVTLVTDDGRVHPIGTCWVREGRASWGTAVDVPVSAIDHVVMAREGTRFTAALT